ncbi:ATP-binding protein [Niastella sp. OAS944]|uniref:sensor histidine kinase n=2 Tax=Niastella sp. OAS944 TaxID=2664089 RepID=UPI003478B142
MNINFYIPSIAWHCIRIINYIANPMQKDIIDLQLFEEFYGGQPQAVIWLSPVWSAGNPPQIVDFAYSYANQQGLEYLQVTAAALNTLTVRTSRTLTDELRTSFYNEMLHVYETCIQSASTIYNPALNKYAHVLRSKLRGGILSVVQDITTEKKMIDQLQQQKRSLELNTRELDRQKTLLDNILKNSSNGISVTEAIRNEQGEVIDALTIIANDAAVKASGLPRDIYLTKRITEIEPSILSTPFYQGTLNTLKTGTPFLYQYQLEYTGNWIEVTSSRLDNDHLIHIFTDITTIKQSQLQLEEFASTLKTVFDATQTGMFIFVPEYNNNNEIIDFRFDLVNATMSSYAQQSPAALMGEPGSKWFPGYLTNGIFDMCRQAYFSNKVKRKEVYYHTDGLDNYIDIQCVKIGNRLLVSFTDHTNLRKSQLKLQQTVSELEQSNRYLEDFAYAASHDMKEPLRKIITFSNILKTNIVSGTTEEDKRILNRIEASARHLNNFVTDLLNFSYISQQRLVKDTVDLNNIVQAIVSELELVIEEKQAKITVSNLPVMQGNARQLEQLFHNLIGNALKYASEQPVITINSSLAPAELVAEKLPNHAKNRQYMLIEVMDNGIGFEQHFAEQIFDIFERLHTRSQYSGSGIGLSIARKVVQNHGGTIWAKSEPGQGAIFYIILPA